MCASLAKSHKIDETNRVDQFEMPIAKDIEIDACFIQLIEPRSAASMFDDLMYKMLISRLDLIAIIKLIKLFECL